MSNSKTVIALSITVAIAGMGWVYAQQQSRHPTLTTDDYIEIEQLYANYVRATDMGGAGDGSDYAATFTSDGEFGDSNPMRGPDALTGLIKNFHERLQRDGWSSRHTYSSLQITPTPEGAKGSVYALIFNVTAEPPFVDHSGVYEDWLVKTPDGWRFKKRIFRHSRTFEPSLPLP